MKTKMRQTSLEAYFKFYPRMRRIDQVYTIIFSAGNEGITDRDIAEQLNLPINCITGRRNELYHQGKVVKTGRFKYYLYENKKTRSIKWKTVVV